MNIGVERVFQSNNWVTLLFVLVFILITMVKILYPKRLNALLGCAFSKNYFLDYANELKETFSLFNALLFCVQNLITGFFLFLVLNKLELFKEVDDRLLFCQLTLGVTIYFAFQYLMNRLLGALFQLSSLFTSVYILKFSYFKVVLICLTPFLLVNYYGFANSDWAYGVTVVVAILLLAIRWFLIVKNNNKLIIGKLFYFILYLCTLEIVPLLVLYKIMVK